MSAPLRLAVVGAKGRVGAAVVRLAAEHGLTVARAVGRKEGVAALSAGDFDVVVDFSSPDILPELAALAAAARTPLVSGTTGLARDGEIALTEASRLIPVLWEPNLSVGVHVLGKLLRQAIMALGASFDVEIVETHHRQKVDAPSGTALRLADIAEEALGGAERKVGREGRPGPRGAREIGIHAVRGGDVVGDHSVHLIGLGERLELVHRATNRDLFAHGALRAARWLVRQAPGRYGIDDLTDS